MSKVNLKNGLIQRYARLSGFLYLAIILIAILNTSLIDTGIFYESHTFGSSVLPLEDTFLLRIGAAVELFMYAAVLGLSWALYIVLREMDERLALLGFIFRAAEAILGGISTILPFLLISFLEQGVSKGAGGSFIYDVVAPSLSGVRGISLDIVLFFVGIGGSIFLYIFYKYRCVPRLLSIWGVITYLSMMTLSFISLIYPVHPTWIESALYGSGALFECVFGLWLMAKGVDLSNMPMSPYKQPL